MVADLDERWERLLELPELLREAREMTLRLAMEAYNLEVDFKTLVGRILDEADILDGPEFEREVWILRYAEKFPDVKELSLKLHEAQAAFEEAKIRARYLEDEFEALKIFWYRQSR